jgi:hypothetical protein
LGLCEVADYVHQLSIEVPTSKIAQKFQSKQFPRHFTKPLLQAAPIFCFWSSVGKQYSFTILALCGWLLRIANVYGFKLGFNLSFLVVVAVDFSLKVLVLLD